MESGLELTILAAVSDDAVLSGVMPATPGFIQRIGS
jgi:hypothetical protein